MVGRGATGPALLVDLRADVDAPPVELAGHRHDEVALPHHERRTLARQHRSADRRTSGLRPGAELPHLGPLVARSRRARPWSCPTWTSASTALRSRRRPLVDHLRSRRGAGLAVGDRAPAGRRAAQHRARAERGGAAALCLHHVRGAAGRSVVSPGLACNVEAFVRRETSRCEPFPCDEGVLLSSVL